MRQACEENEHAGGSFMGNSNSSAVLRLFDSRPLPACWWRGMLDHFFLMGSSCSPCTPCLCLHFAFACVCLGGFRPCSHVSSQYAVLRLCLQPPVIVCWSADLAGLTIFSRACSALGTFRHSETFDKSCFVHVDIDIWRRYIDRYVDI